MASSDLVDIQDVKDWLGVTDSSKDVILMGLIETATQAIEDFIGYPVLAGVRTETINGAGQDTMPLSNIPITAISSLTINDSTVPARASTSGSGYTFDKDFVYLDDYVFEKGRRNVAVSYTSGYETVPPAIKQVALELIQSYFGSQGRDGAVTNYSVPGVISESYAAVGSVDIPDGLKKRLKTFVREYAPT